MTAPNGNDGPHAHYRYRNGGKFDAMIRTLDLVLRLGALLLIPALWGLWNANSQLKERVVSIEANRFTENDAAALAQRMHEWLETVRDNEIERAAETHGEIRRRLEIVERR